MSLFGFLKSTLLSKVVMAVTGVIIVLFVTGHTVGNMQMFAGKETFNAYAHFLQGLGELLWVIRIVMLLSLVLHVITSINLALINSAAKPVKYKVKRYVKAKLTTRTMIWTGLMILAFLVYHILHFTSGTADPSIYGHIEQYALSDGTVPNVLFQRHDAYLMVVQGFKQPIVSIIYLVGVILMGFHLSHAIQSMFQTLGLNHPKYDALISKGTFIWAVVIVLCLISIPITILLGLVGGGA